MADGLDRAVLRAGEDLKPRPQPPDGLMVCTVDRAARAVQLAQKARRGVDGMQPVNAVNLTVALDVLTQRAAKSVHSVRPSPGTMTGFPAHRKLSISVSSRASRASSRSSEPFSA